MPVRKTEDGKWTFGGSAKFDTKKEAEAAYRGYLANKNSKKKKKKKE